MLGNSDNLVRGEFPEFYCYHLGINQVKKHSHKKHTSFLGALPLDTGLGVRKGILAEKVLPAKAPWPNMSQLQADTQDLRREAGWTSECLCGDR